MVTMPLEKPSKSGLTVLLVEDNYLVASAMMQHLNEMGCEVVGPVPSVDEGVRMIEESERLDGGILDINIIGGSSEPVAKALQGRGLPFFFITGYASPNLLGSDYDEALKLRKPLDHQQLREAVGTCFGSLDEM